jgi:hypothetical protein
MKGLFYLVGLALIFDLSHPAFAGAYDQIKSRSACEQAGAVWDQETSTCVAKRSKTACAQRGGTWDEGTSSCSVPKINICNRYVWDSVR